MKKLYLLLIVACFSTTGFTQSSSCAQTLRLAQSTYDQGRLHELEGILKSCLAAGFTKEEKVSALKLLTLAYIYLEEPTKADETMLLLLQTDHYFEINPAVDPAEFVALHRTFRTTPVFRIGLKAGTTITKPNVLNFNPITEGNGEYKHRYGFDIGVFGEIPLAKKFTINPGLHYSLKTFQGTWNSVLSGSTVPYSTSIGIESENWFAVPLSVQYNILGREESKKKKQNFISRLNPYLIAGFSFDFLLNSSLLVEQKRTEEQSIELRTISLSPQREKFNLSAIVGAGGKIKAGGGYIIGEIRYLYGFNEINSSSTLLENQQLLFDYGYVDGIFKINSLFINVGYAQNFFNPKKVKNKIK